MQIIGQKENLEIINSWNKPPNFIIIQGDEHTGKKYLTVYICKRFNLRYVSINKSVSAIRRMVDGMAPNTNMLYHLEDFHTASINAKNALLKVTEEPLEGNYIVITGKSQIKTLESRARKIIMAPYSKEELSEYMSLYYPDISTQEILIDVGINSPAKVAYYKQYDQLEKLAKYAIEISKIITYISPESIINILSRFENRYDNIDPVLLFLNMLINVLENNIKEKGYFSYFSILNILIQGKTSLINQPTLKRKLLLYDIFYKINQINKGIKVI